MHQVLDTEDGARTQDDLRDTPGAVAAALQTDDAADFPASGTHEISQSLAAILASAHACTRWLTAEPANIERARLAAERIIRDADAAAQIASRLRSGRSPRAVD